MLGIFVGRQAIYDRNLEVIGYELLFRSYEAEQASVTDGDQATTEVILNTFMEIGLERLVGSGMAFINLTRSFFLEKYPLPMLQDRVVLEVLEDITLDDELIAGVRALSDSGFTIALDDVVHPKDIKQLLDIANIVKLDIVALELDRLDEYVKILRKHNVKLLAEKVETLDIFNLCKKLGFDYFQGFFLSKPHVVKGQRIPESRLAIIRLLSKIKTPDITFKEIEEIIRQDVSLSYKLLRLINSSFYSLPTKITSIQQAITLLGLKHIQNWVQLIFLSKIEDKPRDLIVTAMIRAKMCELISMSLEEQLAEMGFIVGLFSVLDALLDMPLEEIIPSLPFSDDITNALLQHVGPLGNVLHCVLAYEKGDWDKVLCLNHKPEVVRDAYLKSLDWSAEVGLLLED
ncbi:EAL and HDOD domain-containing protein [Candidatus Latescibacterota bacterium]